MNNVAKPIHSTERTDMPNVSESAANRDARELAELLELLLPQVRASVAYADDALSMRVARAARSLGDAADTVVSASAIMGGD